MRVLIVSAALFACALARPSGLLLPAVAPAVVAPLAPLAVSSPGDLQAAAINAHVKASDANQQLVDQAREIADLGREQVEGHVEVINANAKTAESAVIEAADQARDLSEQAFWNSEDQKWQAIDRLKTYESEVDGAIAAQSAEIANNAILAPAVVAAPAVAAPAFVAPAVKTVIAEPAPVIAAAPYISATPILSQTVIKPETRTVVTQSLSQTHPAPAPKFAATYVEPAPVVAVNSEPIFAAAPALVKTAPVVAAAPIYSQTVIKPETKTVVTQSLSQTHPAPAPKFAATIVEPAPVLAVKSEPIFAAAPAIAVNSFAAPNYAFKTFGPTIVQPVPYPGQIVDEHFVAKPGFVSYIK